MTLSRERVPRKDRCALHHSSGCGRDHHTLKAVRKFVSPLAKVAYERHRPSWTLARQRLRAGLLGGNRLVHARSFDSCSPPHRSSLPRHRIDVSSQVLPSDVRIGHVHLRVADLDRALAFYQGVLGFQLTQRFGSQAAFLSAGGYHHHIGLNTWESLGGEPPPQGSTGLYHLAVLYPTRAALGVALRRLLDHGVRLDGAADHGVSEALYLRDPDQNGVELYWDRPREAWPKDADGNLTMFTRPLDLHALLREADGAAAK